jgi:8-oxo-dGTP pyrophosphatase MutT (NUDIX family)
MAFMPVAPPSPSSTVVLMREPAAGAPPECLLLQRHAAATWLGGAWVFPGGRVDDGDREPSWDDLVLGTARLHAGWPEVDAAWLRDHAVAAAREVFEETGVLFAETVTPRRADQPPVHSAAGDSQAERRALLDGLASFASLCGERRWKLRLDQFVPFSRWITPDQERRRFDTVFFLASAPAQALRMHEHEMAAHAWVTPRDALARFAQQAIDLAPPTLRTLEDLAPHTSLEAALAWARAVPRHVIAPKLLEDSGGRWLLLPGDPEYPGAVTSAVRPPTRFAFQDGRWRSAHGPTA